jgi:hypothetical protein
MYKPATIDPREETTAMKRHVQVWRRILAAVVVATGVAVVWCLAAGWLTSLAGLFAGRDSVSEGLQVALDGTPVIEVDKRIGGDTTSLSRRTIEGKPWPNDYEYWLGGAYLEGHGKPPGVVRLPIKWRGDYSSERVASVQDGKRPPTAWYLIRDGEPAGHLYLAAFDPMSKAAVGFIGKAGFRLSTPAIAEQFAFPEIGSGRINNYVATTQYLETGRLRTNYYLPIEERTSPWLLFIVDGDHLWEVDLRERAARQVLQLPGITSIGMVRTPEATIGLPTENDASGDIRRTPFRLAAADVTLESTLPATEAAAADAIVPAPTTKRPKMTSLIVICTENSVVLYDSPTDRRWTFALPAELPNDELAVYCSSLDELLFQYRDGFWSGGPVLRLLWIKPDGTVTRREKLELQGWVPPPPRNAAWAAAAAAPVPIAWLVGVLAGYPLNLLQDNNVDRYAEALKRSWNICWPPLALVIGVSLAAAWIARGWQRKYRRSATGMWCTFVFLAGVPGLAAYWFEHRRSTLEACGECSQIVPRDRDACAACNTPFPAPPPIGTEIFA